MFVIFKTDAGEDEVAVNPERIVWLKSNGRLTGIHYSKDDYVVVDGSLAATIATLAAGVQG